MTDETRPPPTILVVDDEEQIADSYARALSDRYETRTAYSGEEGLELIDDDIDVVLLDRRMPGISGDAVLERVRDEGYGGAVIMVTAVDPNLNILEMDFDDYLCKPVSPDTLLNTIDQHLDRVDRESERLDEFFTLVSKISVLEDEMSRSELRTSQEYEQLRQRAEALGNELRNSVDDFEAIVSTYRDINRK
ncbi:MAG: response regulator [Haloarculaceae archaeon]